MEIPPEHELWIKSLTSVVDQKRAALEGLGVMSINGKNDAERMQMSLSYSQATAELNNAEEALRAAMAVIAKERERNDAK